MAVFSNLHGSVAYGQPGRRFSHITDTPLLQRLIVANSRPENDVLVHAFWNRGRNLYRAWSFQRT